MLGCDVFGVVMILVKKMFLAGAIVIILGSLAFYFASKRTPGTKEKREKEILLLVHEQMEKEEYEEAIEALDRFAGIQDMTKETMALRETAVKKLVDKERNRAAKFFLMAKRTREPSKRETYLLSSYHILKGLIEKYPSSALIEKLNSHLQKVKTEMDKYGVEPG